MSVDGKMCRICLAVQKTSRFNQIFGNNGKIAKQIYEITGIKILEFQQCPALICPKCTGNLQRAHELRNSIIDNNRHFNEIYKLCQFEEYDIDFAAVSQASQWTEDPKLEIKIESVTSKDFKYQPLEVEEFIISDVIKEEPKEEEFTTEAENYEYPATEIRSEIKEEPKEVQDYKFSSVSDELLQSMDSTYSEDYDEYLDEISLSTSQYSSELNRSEHSLTIYQKKRRALSPNQLERKRELDRLRKQRKRLTETEEEREARRIADTARQRRRRELMKDQHLRNRLCLLKRRSQETEEQRQKRLEAERLRMAEKRKTETEEQRQKRLEAERNRVAMRRKTESEEERKQRLEAQRIRVARRRNANKMQQP